MSVRLRFFTQLVLLCIWMECLVCVEAQSQSVVTISGTVRDARTGELLIGVSVVARGASKSAGTTTNAYGFYSLTIPTGATTVSVSYVGFVTQTISLTLTANHKLDVQLQEEAKDLQEVVVSQNRGQENVQQVGMSVNKLDIKTIKSMPALLGEVDVIRSLQALPGVSSAGEGGGGFNVRGGGSDQNLIIQDEATVYNASHLFGFFSVFNPDAVKDVKLYKGGIPAQYGGRLSSVLDVRLKEGNIKRFSSSGGIGLMSSRLTLEAPVVKDRSSFIVTARRSYADLLLKLSSTLADNALYFYDVTAKWNYTLNANNSLYVSGYFGKDNLGFGRTLGLNWANNTGTLRWNHVFTPKLFTNITFAYSNYTYQLKFSSGSSDFDWNYSIRNANLKADFAYYVNQSNTLTFGASATRYRFQPGRVTASETSSLNGSSLDNQHAIEYGVYLDNETTVSAKLSMQYGLRFSAWDFQGPYTTYQYVGTDGERKTPVEEQTYTRRSIAAYTNLEPRFSMRYQLNAASSFKASYNRTAQYVHLISNTTAASPLDIWWPTTNNTKPELADQVALGYFRNFSDNTIEASLEGYYKKLTNQVDYIDGANTRLNKYLEGDLLYGQGRAYGMELYVKKNGGLVYGWVSYTLSKTEKQINGINNNNWYNAKYDRTHNLSVVVLYEASKKWTLSSIFSYQTGVATTFPSSKYVVQGIAIPHRSDNARNNYRVPAYHRLDLSATHHPAPRENGKPRRGYWSFSIYNFYSRRNAFSVYFQQDEDNPNKTNAVRLSIFGSMIPSATYNFSF